MEELRLYGVLDDSIQEIVELTLERADAERVVAAWDEDEPDHAGALTVIVIEISLSLN